MQSPRFAALMLSATAVAVFTTGCSLALDWREVRVPGTSLLALMPCKPGLHQRQLVLAGETVTLSLQACNAAGLTWAIVASDLKDPARVRAALDELALASARNLSAPVTAEVPLAVRGSTPNDRSRRYRVVGALPDGTKVTMDSAVFTQGTWVFQATVMGEHVDADQRENLFANLRMQP
jgi:hypothetical protein